MSLPSAPAALALTGKPRRCRASRIRQGHKPCVRGPLGVRRDLLAALSDEVMAIPGKSPVARQGPDCRGEPGDPHRGWGPNWVLETQHVREAGTEGSQTRRWREVDSNFRSPVKDQLVETVLFDFPAEVRKRTIGGRRSQPRDLGGDLRRDHNLRDDNDRLGWGRRQAQNGWLS